MVSSGTVNGKLETFTEVMTNYKSGVDEFTNNSWSGPSHDSFVSKASEFVSEFQSTIESQLANFASVADLNENLEKMCEQYHQYEKNIKYLEAMINAASEDEDTSELVKALADAQAALQEQLENIKQEEANINVLLDAIISAPELTANKTSADIAPVTTLVSEMVEEMTRFSSDAKVQAMIDMALEIVNDPRYGYATGGYGKNTGYTFDCGGLVWYLLKHVYGLDYDTYQGISPYQLVAQLPKYGFQTYNTGAPVDANQLRPGDILVNPSVSGGHAALYAGDGKMIEARYDFSKGSGDPDGDEITVTNYYDRIKDFRYTYVIRTQGYGSAGATSA